jgi:transposase
MPAVGVRTAARILIEVVSEDFESARHLASYAGPVPVTWRLGTSFRSNHSSRRSSKILKRALFFVCVCGVEGPTIEGVLRQEARRA